MSRDKDAAMRWRLSCETDGSGCHPLRARLVKGGEAHVLVKVAMCMDGERLSLVSPVPDTSGRLQINDGRVDEHQDGQGTQKEKGPSHCHAFG